MDFDFGILFNLIQKFEITNKNVVITMYSAPNLIAVI